MINFKANYINTVPIKIFNNIAGEYQSADVSFVEIDVKNQNDIYAVNRVVSLWEDRSFADNIAYDVNNHNKGIFKKFPFRVFALTNQRRDFDTLDSCDILALTEIEKKSDDNIFLEYLQVDPRIVYNIGIPQIKRCGSAVLDCLKQLFSDKSIFLNSRAEKFYTKNGFVKIGQNQYFWNKFLK